MYWNLQMLNGKMHSLHLTLGVFLFVLQCSAGPIAHFLPKIRDLRPSDESVQVYQTSPLVPHNLQGSVSVNPDDALTVVPVTPSLTYSPPVPDTRSADDTHSTAQSSHEQPSVSVPGHSYTITTQLSTSSTPTISDYLVTTHQSPASSSVPTLNPIPTLSQPTPTVYGHTTFTMSEQMSVPSGSPTIYTPPLVQSSEQQSTQSSPIPSPPRGSSQVSSKPSPTVHTPTVYPNGQHSTGSQTIPPLSMNSAQSPSVSTPLSGSHGTVYPTKPTEQGPSLSPSLSGSLTPTTHLSPTDSMTDSTSDLSSEISAATASSTDLTVGVIGLLPGAVSSSYSPTLTLNDPLETITSVHSNSATPETATSASKPSSSLPTPPNPTSPVSSDTPSHSRPSLPQTRKTPPPTIIDGFPIESTTSNSAQKTPLSSSSQRLPANIQHTTSNIMATTVSDPVIVIVTPGQSTSWINTWLHVSESASTSSQSPTTATTATTTSSSSSATTIIPSGTIPIPQIPTGPSMDPDTTVPEPTASHTHGDISKETESATIIHATSTMTKVVTVTASDEHEHNEPVHTTEPEAANANPTKGPKKVTVTEYKTEEVDNTPMPPFGKTNPTMETGLPATANTKSQVTPTGMLDDTFQGLQVVPVTPQGFVTVTETKTETTTETKTETETVYIKPTVTVRVTDG